MEVADLWFSDGTIVVRAEEKLFRLHGGLLAACSPVFKAIIEHENNASQIHGVDIGSDLTGLTLITIQEVSGNDAHNFFLAIYDPGFFEAPPATASINCVLGILKMATKFRVKALRRRALAHLNLTFPLTLEEWDERATLSTLSFRRDANTSTPFQSTFESAIAIVNTAEKVDAQWIKPAAIYECCTYDPDHFLVNPVWNDGVTISEELKKTIIMGAFAHRNATRIVLKFLVSPPCKECEQPQECLEVKRGCNEHHATNFPLSSPLSIWEDGDWEGFLDGLCQPCEAQCWEQHSHARHAVRKELPKEYGLEESWGVLQEKYSMEMF
ncbi:hypothetical protein BDN70DRAFT_209286 [Pholiota conissans]|uniref:BTB domain-containing protein n=1 Tax=Pholiota conissans TaxID=109636 RepID=A0A9P5YW80_9AGAR|nr:hypothetical protein BDN70DRAFT_209286 [Pholiota conissans]